MSCSAAGPITTQALEFYTTSSKEQCTICQEPLCADGEDSAVVVGHIAYDVLHGFHESCAAPWYKTRRDCVTCRMPLTNIRQIYPPVATPEPSAVEQRDNNPLVDREVLLDTLQGIAFISALTTAMCVVVRLVTPR